MTSARLEALLVPLALLTACGPDTPATSEGSTGEATSSGTATTTSSVPTEPSSTGEPTTTDAQTTGPGPAVCGDGVLDGDELCDDGNLDADDGCSAECQPLADIAWTVTHNGAADDTDVAVGVAVDAAGQIYVVGAETADDRDALILALSPDGTELWRRTYDGLAGLNDYFLDVVLDDAGNIYVAGYEEVAADRRAAVVRAFESDGEPLWRFAEEPPEPGYATADDLVLADGALHSVGIENLGGGAGQLVVRRHALATGAAAWRNQTQAGWPGAYGQGITAAGGRIIAVGYVQDDTEVQPLTVVLDGAGAIESEQVQATPWGVWHDIVPIGGDLLLVGRTVTPGMNDPDVIVRRVDENFDELWTHILDHEGLEDMGNAVAVGANESILVAGVVIPAAAPAGGYDILGARYTGDGALLWTDVYDQPDAHADDYGNAAAAGPGFFVLAGYETTLERGLDVWVRRYDD